ncbi:hypothetical protein C8F01DRAFT_1088744 [Mycena amicta]|nr:hypothetical protein C8F01DRAFT_1088744 [Mycena amicta]
MTCVTSTSVVELETLIHISVNTADIDVHPLPAVFLTAVDVVNNDELKCWTVTGDGRGGVMDGDGDGRCLKWLKGPNGDPQLAGVWEPTSSPSSKKGRIGYSTLLTRRDMGAP